MVCQRLELCRHVVESVEYAGQEQLSASSHSEETQWRTVTYPFFNHFTFQGQVTDVAEHVVLQVECVGEPEGEWVLVDGDMIPVSCAQAGHRISCCFLQVLSTSKTQLEGRILVEQQPHFRVYLLRRQQQSPEVACACDSTLEAVLSDFKGPGRKVEKWQFDRAGGDVSQAPFSKIFWTLGQTSSIFA